jgi:hypothetical protein
MSTDHDNRPSIDELQRVAAKPGDPAAQSVLLRADVCHVLLEIAAAALAANGPCDHPDGRCAHGSHFRGCSRFDGEKRLKVALGKVRP